MDQCKIENCTNKIYCKKDQLCRKHKKEPLKCKHEGCTKTARFIGSLCLEHSDRTAKKCTHDNCDNQAILNGLCTIHGGRKKCTHENCTNIAIVKGVCRKHGASIPICITPGCNNVQQRNNICIKCGAEMPRCSVEECNNKALQGGHCLRHGAILKETTSKCKICLKLWGSKRFTTEGEMLFSCSDCFYKKFPNEPRPKIFRRKEKFFDSYIKVDFGDDFFKLNKRIKGGDSEKRPDWYHVFDDYCLIIECDEIHSNPYHLDEEQEANRLEIIKKDLKGLPIKVIRFSPDECEDHPGCFNQDYEVDHEEFYRRYKILKDTIDNVISGVISDELTILFK